MQPARQSTSGTNVIGLGTAHAAHGRKRKVILANGPGCVMFGPWDALARGLSNFERLIL